MDSSLPTLHEAAQDKRASEKAAGGDGGAAGFVGMKQRASKEIKGQERTEGPPEGPAF